MISPTLWDHALALLVGLVVPLSALLRAGRGEAEPTAELDPREKIAGYWANAGVLLLLAGLVVALWLWRGRPLDALGLTRPPERLATGLGLAALFLLLWAVDTWSRIATPERLAATRERWRRDTPFMPRTAREVRHSLALVVSAAVGEEVIYRGFLIAYVGHFTGDSALGLAAAVAAPALVFGLAHLYQGPRAVVKIALLASLFGALLVVTGSLWIPIALHFVADLAGSLLGPWILGPYPAGTGRRATD